MSVTKISQDGTKDYEKQITWANTTLSSITIPEGKNTMIVGPVTMPDLTVQGNLNVVDSLTITGTLTVSNTGHLRIV